MGEGREVTCRGGKRRYFLELLGIGARKKGSKGRPGRGRERSSNPRDPPDGARRWSRGEGRGGEKAIEDPERERGLFNPHLRSGKAGKSAAQKLNPLGVGIHLKAATR